MIDWVQSVLFDLIKCRDTAHHAVTSSVLLACFLHQLRQFYNIQVSDDLNISLLQAICLSVTNGEKELNFLRSMIKKSSKAKYRLFILIIIFKNFCLGTVL